MPKPRVTLGIPLYRGNAFFETIVANIDAIDDPRVEFLIADHHQLDDAATRLEERYANDERVRVVKTTDEIPWYANYSFLMREGRGDYVRILTQDDPVVPRFLDEAMGTLDERPAAVGAIGPIDLIDGEDTVFQRDRRHGYRRTWTRTGDAFGTIAGWRHYQATHGLWRRSVLVENDLFLEPSHLDTVLTVRMFAAAAALHGPIVWVPGYESLRRVHPTSYTRTHWQKSLWDQVRRVGDYVRRAARTAVRQSRNAFMAVLRVPLLVVGAVFIPLLRISQRVSGRAAAERRAMGLQD